MIEFEVATVGDNCIDRFIGVSPISFVGGNALNVAVQLSRLGRRCAYFGAVGNDAEGERIIRILSENGVIADFVRVVDGVTAYTEVERNAKGERKFVFEEFGVVNGYRTDSRDLPALSATRHVHIGWLNDGGTLRNVLLQKSVSVSQDISVNAKPHNLGVAGLDIAFASADGLTEEVQRFAEGLIKAGARLAVVTRGDKGSMATDGKDFAAVDATKIEPVDTTGAGDAFIAGFLNAWLNALPLEQSLEWGRVAGTAACLHFGGFPQDVPTP